MPDMDWDIKQTAGLKQNQSYIIVQGGAEIIF